MFKVYDAEYRRRYYAPICSFSTFCCVVAFLATLSLSFFVPFATKQFWIKSNLYYEQPIVKFRGELYLALIRDGINSNPLYTYSTHNAINSIPGDVVQTFVDYGNEDKNFDGIIDVIKIKAVLDFPPGANRVDTGQLRRIDLAIGLDYMLNQTTKIAMKSGFFVSFNTPLGKSNIQAIGDLMLKQKTPIKVHNTRKQLYNGESIFVPLFTKDYWNAVEEYNGRNETLEYQKNVIINFTNQENITIDLTIYIPTHQEVAYETTMQELLKMGWLQYFYLLVPIYFIVYEIVMWALVKYKVMLTKVKEDELLTS